MVITIIILGLDLIIPIIHIKCILYISHHFDIGCLCFRNQILRVNIPYLFSTNQFFQKPQHFVRQQICLFDQQCHQSAEEVRIFLLYIFQPPNFFLTICTYIQNTVLQKWIKQYNFSCTITTLSEFRIQCKHRIAFENMFISRRCFFLSYIRSQLFINMIF